MFLASYSEFQEDKRCIFTHCFCYIYCYQVITKCIRCAFVEDHTNERDQTEEGEHETGQPSDVVTLTIPAIHLSFNRIQRRIHMCAEALQVWPEAISKFDAATNNDLLTLFKLEREMVNVLQRVYKMCSFNLSLNQFRVILFKVIICLNSDNHLYINLTGYHR